MKMPLTTPPVVETTWPELHDAVYRAKNSAPLDHLKRLLDGGVDLRQTAHTHSASHMSVLHTATNSNAEVVDLLMHHGAAALLDEKCGPGEDGRWAGLTALQMAAKKGRREVAQALLAHGAHYDAFSAVALGDTNHLIELLNTQSHDLNLKDDYQATLLHWAVGQDERLVAELLIERGANINAHDDFDESPLLVASVRQSAQEAVISFGQERGLTVVFDSLVDLLLDHGAKLDIFSCAALGKLPELSDLLRKDAKLVRAANGHGTTPLHWAARNNQIEAAKLLLADGADINAADSIGCSPLWYAAYWGRHTEMTRFLCKRNANIKLRNLWNKDLASYDCGHECWAMIKMYGS